MTDFRVAIVTQAYPALQITEAGASTPLDVTFLQGHPPPVGSLVPFSTIGNADGRQVIAFSSACPHARVSSTTSTNITNGDLTTNLAGWSTAGGGYAVDGMTALSGGIRAPYTGDYDFTAQLTWDTNSGTASRRGVLPVVNGTEPTPREAQIIPNATIDSTLTDNVAGQIRLQANDVFGLIAYQSSGATLAVVSRILTVSLRDAL